MVVIDRAGRHDSGVVPEGLAQAVETGQFNVEIGRLTRQLTLPLRSETELCLECS